MKTRDLIEILRKLPPEKARDVLSRLSPLERKVVGLRYDLDISQAGLTGDESARFIAAMMKRVTGTEHEKAQGE